MGHGFGPGGSECGLSFFQKTKKVSTARRIIEHKLKRVGEMLMLGILSEGLGLLEAKTEFASKHSMIMRSKVCEMAMLAISSFSFGYQDLMCRM